MPAPPPLTRRQALSLAIGAGPAMLLAACTTEDASTPQVATSGAVPGGDVTSAGAMALDESALVAAYQSVLDGFADLDVSIGAVLTEIRDQHAQHRDALGGAPPATAAETLASSLDAAIAGLMTRERAAARARRRACVEAEDPASARLLALIGASEASHVPALREVRA